MITVVSGSNRRHSKCLFFAKKFVELIQAKGHDAQLLALEDIPPEWIFPEMYNVEQQKDSFFELQDTYFRHVDKVIYVSSEYNGSIPGALKLLIDAMSVRALKDTFSGKKAALIGIASGRAGNLRGMDHLADILQHLGTIVLPNKLPISQIGALLNEQNEIVDQPTIDVMEQQVVDFLAF